MPNHITNILQLIGEKQKIKELIDFVKNEEQPFSLENINPTNSEDWYTWRIDNWGTKWDVYELTEWVYDEKCTSISFFTAWSTPYKAIQSLSKRFPEIKISVKYADEDTGYNLGRYEVLNGEIINEFHPDKNSSVKYAKEIFSQRFKMEI